MKWTKKCKADKLLREKFANGDIQFSDAPKTIYASEMEFQKYPLNVFRNHFNKAKSEHGVNLRSNLFELFFEYLANSILLLQQTLSKMMKMLMKMNHQKKGSVLLLLLSTIFRKDPVGKSCRTRT